jgi:hypothetical protein
MAANRGLGVVEFEKLDVKVFTIGRRAIALPAARDYPGKARRHNLGVRNDSISQTF